MKKNKTKQNLPGNLKSSLRLFADDAVYATLLSDYKNFFYFLQRSPLSTQDQNIMASKQMVKPKFTSKLRPPSAVKRLREPGFTNSAPPNCEVCI